MSSTASMGTTTGQRWGAFGDSGAAGTILHTDEGYAVRLLADQEPPGAYPSREIAKSAMDAAMPPGSNWPEFREHCRSSSAQPDGRRLSTLGGGRRPSPFLVRDDEAI